jgi:hypothetical protein
MSEKYPANYNAFFNTTNLPFNGQELDLKVSC